MNSIFEKVSNEEMIARINQLTPQTKAIWGKMEVDQMLKHTNEAILIAFGENTLKINFMMRLLGRMMKNKVFNSGFKKNSPTAPEFIFNESYDFEVSKSKLIANFSRFAKGHESITIINHPFWGKMTYEDWDKLMWNHLDHHLRQFGV
ncbi:DUF1569 domain-containing protein [Flavobacterium sp.]|uniref:DUF1569 domain-containing protein n=1 Tax=Flavobacterium sp. TaxID=239 RepID=UPI00379E8506